MNIKKMFRKFRKNQKRILKALRRLENIQQQQQSSIAQLAQKIEDIHVFFPEKPASSRTAVENAVISGVTTVVASGNSANNAANFLQDIQNTLSPGDQTLPLVNSLLQSR